MAITLVSKTIRVPLNAGSYDGFVDQLTNAAVKFPIADLRIEAGLFYGKPNTVLQLVSLANIVSITCTFKAVATGGGAPEASAANLMQAVVLAEDFANDLTQQTWDDLSKCHVAFNFAEAQVNNLSKGNVWVVFTALLDTGKVIPLKFGAMEAVQDGYASAGTDPVTQDTAYTKAESDALYFSRAPINGTYRIKTDETGSYLQLKNATNGKFHTLFVTGDTGAEAIAIGAGEV